MEEIKLTAEKREGTGKGNSRKMRSSGRIPAVLYGPEIDAATISLDERELSALLRSYGSSNILINLYVGKEKKPRKVIFRDLQKEPVRGSIEHVDLYQVSPTKRITLTTRVELTGVPEGVTEGGILQHILRDIDIACLPADIPEKVEVDVSELNIGDSIHVDELSIDKVEILTNPTRTVVTVVPPTIIKAPVPEEAEVAEGEEVPAEGEEAPAEGEAAPAEGEEAKEGKEAREGKKDEGGKDKKK